MSQFNYRHLYYFWVVAKEGGMSRAADRLGMAVQTISTQVRELERDLGHLLLKPDGRKVALTPAGWAVYRQAEQIFQLGEHLPELLRQTTQRQQVSLRVGISDGLPKVAIPKLLAPALARADLRLECHDDEFDDLLADLALHRLDMVLADRPAPANANLRLYNHPLGRSPLVWLGTAQRAAEWTRAEAEQRPPLSVVPVLLPTVHAEVRRSLDHWFEQQDWLPNLVGEFEDSALLATFGATGMGVFPAPAMAMADLEQRFGLVRLADGPGVHQQFYLIGSEKKVMHPLIKAILDAPDLLAAAG